MAEVVGAVVGDGQRVFPFGAGRPEGDTGLVAQAHGVDFHFLMRIDAVGARVGHLDAHDGAAAGHVRLDHHAGLCRHADRQQRPGHAAVRGFDVEAGMHHVAAHRIMRRGAMAVLVLDPERIVRDVRPAVIIRIREAAVAREAQRKIDVAVLAGDAAVAVVANRQILDDQLEFAVDAVHFPNLLTVFGNVGLAVLRAVADLVHHRFERALADLAQELSLLIEDLDMRRVDLVRLGAAKENAGNRHPQVSVLVDCGRRRGIEPGSKHADLIAGRHDNFGGVRLERLTFWPWAAPRLLCARLHQAHERRCGHRHTEEKLHDTPPLAGLVSTPTSI